mmetsp:Transcript_62289/g.91321  ORF Transcript_62289/g.91321 Transcript_62289/m.91321 type:complete len:234 (-) Transcript_62289:24-725(-)
MLCNGCGMARGNGLAGMCALLALGELQRTILCETVGRSSSVRVGLGVVGHFAFGKQKSALLVLIVTRSRMRVLVHHPAATNVAAHFTRSKCQRLFLGLVAPSNDVRVVMDLPAPANVAKFAVLGNRERTLLGRILTKRRVGAVMDVPSAANVALNFSLSEIKCLLLVERCPSVRSDALVVAVDGGLVVHFNHVGLNKSQGSSLIELSTQVRRSMQEDDAHTSDHQSSRCHICG